jgi:hypothetical protein
VAAELKIMLGADDHPPIEPVRIAGIGYLALATECLDEHACATLGRLSGCYATFHREHDRLRPIEIIRPDLFDDDLVTIPKYPGKTNEQFTRLLINVTLASMRRPSSGPMSILDPLCGRGTVLSTAMMLGCNAAGVEVEAKAVEAYAAYLRSYLRRKRLKHNLEVNPVRREGKIIGKRLEAAVIPNGRERPIALTVFSGDTRQSGALFGKRRFEAVVTDAPYGVIHGSRTDVSGVGGRDRSAAGLISEALPVWTMQLKPGGALGLSSTPSACAGSGCSTWLPRRAWNHWTRVRIGTSSTASTPRSAATSLWHSSHNALTAVGSPAAGGTPHTPRSRRRQERLQERGAH